MSEPDFVIELAFPAAKGAGMIKIEITTGPYGYATPDAKMIVEECLPGWLCAFLQENAEYQGQVRQFGELAEVIEMYRKLAKLRAAWVDRVPTLEWREPPDTVLRELISHAFLAAASREIAAQKEKAARGEFG